LGDLGENGRLILNWILKKWGVIQLLQDRVQWQTLVNEYSDCIKDYKFVGQLRDHQPFMEVLWFMVR
jgi:hypothetical protein